MSNSSETLAALGRRLKAVRLELGLSQTDTAYLAQLDVSNYGKIERGKANPSLTTLTRIATVLNTTVSELTRDVTAQTLPEKERRFTARDYLAAKQSDTLPQQQRWL